MARKPIGPLLVIAALAAMGYAGARAETYEVQPHVHCNFHLARLKQPAADILFVGNSRAGSAIDPVYVSERIERQIGRKLTIDRLSLPSTTPTPLNIVTREYLRERGHPAYAVVQLAYNRYPDKQHLVDLPVHDLRSIAFGRMDDLADLQSGAVLNDAGARLPRWLEKGYQSLPAVAMTKVTTSIYAAMRYPIRAKAGGIPDCTGKPGLRQLPFWQYGDLSDSGTYPDERPSGGDLAEWKKEIAGFVPVDPAAPERTFENHQLHRLIADLQAGGARVFVTFYPTLSEPLPAATVAKFRTEFPEAEFIDVVAPFRAAAGPDESGKYRDGKHVNRPGALLVSRAMADRLAERLK
jgi:hypothetical protein